MENEISQDHECPNPWQKMVDASSGDIRRLASVWRYSSIPIVIPENVADHMYWTAIYSVMIHSQLQGLSTDSARKKYGKKSVLLAILLKAITHDMAEAVTGDIIRPFKYSSPTLKEEIDRAEKDMVETRLPKEVKEIAILADQMTSFDNSEYVNAVVKAADFLSLYQFMRREVLRGNAEIRDFVQIMVEDFEKLPLTSNQLCDLPSASTNNDPYPLNLLNSYYRYLETCAKGLHEVLLSSRRIV
jgi:5'-deoxynucleotidase YfbR-like HD superfamily hydrolase